MHLQTISDGTAIASTSSLLHHALQVAIGIGQLSWADQCFGLAIALEPSHGEALNNLGVLESKKGQLTQVRLA